MIDYIQVLVGVGIGSAVTTMWMAITCTRDIQQAASQAFLEGYDKGVKFAREYQTVLDDCLPMEKKNDT